jgi:hypothetical protein
MLAADQTAGEVWGHGWRRCSAGDQSHGGSSPELGDLGASGVKTTRAWVWEVQHDMGKAPRPLRGLGRLGKEESTAGVDLCDIQVDSMVTP